ncbi:hypothetical protein D9M68_904220 [compost metagenome]
MHHLSTGMHGRVGTPGTDHRHRLRRHLGQRPLQRLLHGSHASLLALPTAIARALVFDAQGNPGNASGSHLGCRNLFIYQRLTPFSFPRWLKFYQLAGQ